MISFRLLPCLALALALPGISLAAAQELSLRGFLKPVEQVTLSSRAKGTTSMVAEEGLFVRAGEIVMRLDDAMERTQVEQQKSVVEKREFEDRSYAKLSRDGGISEDQAMTARINLQIARLQLEQAETQLERTAVKAPFSGYISRRFREPGEAVDEFIPVLTLVDFSEVLLEAHVSVDWIARVREGQEVEVTVGAYPDQVFEGRISFISPVVDPSTHEFMVRVRVPNEEERLRPGMRATGLLRPAALAEVSASTE